MRGKQVLRFLQSLQNHNGAYRGENQDLLLNELLPQEVQLHSFFHFHQSVYKVFQKKYVRCRFVQESIM